MDAFVPKPFDVDQLLDTIVRLIQRRAGNVQTARDASGLFIDGLGGSAKGRSGGAWDALPLFDAEEAQRKWHRSETLMRHLQTFAREHSEDGTKLLEHLQMGGLQDLTGVAHKLRGAAGALSLPRCMAIATAIEESAQSSHLEKQLQAWVEEMLSVLQATICRIEDYLQTHKPALAKAVVTVPASLPLSQGDTTQQAQAQRGLLAQLRAGVATDDPEQVEQYLPTLAQLLPMADLHRLHLLIDTFDFDGVNQWISSIESELDTETNQ
jgi:HPt (histidine-containing phosphotransfer) domain-containing protein